MIYYDCTAGRGDYDDDFDREEHIKLAKYIEAQKQNKIQKKTLNRIPSKTTSPTEWTPTPPANNKIHNRLNFNQNSNSKNTPRANKYNRNQIVRKSQNNRNYKNRNLKQTKLILGSKYSSSTKSEETVHASFSVPSNINNLQICTQATVDFAPSSPVFFNPIRISGENPLIIALKHDKYLKKKNYNKTFSTMTSKCLFSQNIITSSSVFELRPCNDALAI